jgi:proteasome accessory factor C
MRVLTELPDGHCEVSMTFAAEEWMTRLILGFGADVEVRHPDSLVRSVKRAATAALAAYGELDD